MSDKLRQNNKALKRNVFITPCCTHTDTWVHMAFQWLTNTAVVVAGQLVTRVALTVVWALCIHTSVHAVVGQGALVSVYRKTQTHTRTPVWVKKVWVVRYIAKLIKRRYSDFLKKLDSGFNHVIKREERVFMPTHPYSGLRSSGSLEDTGRCRSLWCCSTSVRSHKCVFLSHIHLCLQ